MAYPYGAIHQAVTSQPLAITYDATISSSTALSLNAKTTGIEVTAVDKSILLKWGGTASPSSFDGVIAANSTKVFSVPLGVTSVQFIEQSATALLFVIEF